MGPRSTPSALKQIKSPWHTLPALHWLLRDASPSVCFLQWQNCFDTFADSQGPPALCSPRPRPAAVQCDSCHCKPILLGCHSVYSSSETCHQPSATSVDPMPGCVRGVRTPPLNSWRDGGRNPTPSFFSFLPASTVILLKEVILPWVFLGGGP